MSDDETNVDVIKDGRIVIQSHGTPEVPANYIAFTVVQARRLARQLDDACKKIERLA